MNTSWSQASRRLTVCAVAVLLFAVGGVQAAIIPVDLNTFIPFSPEDVTIAPDGSSAVLMEDAEFMTDLSRMDLAIPADALSFVFGYELSVAAGNEDYLAFYFGDTSAPVFSRGGLEGVYAGVVSMDMAPYRGSSVPVVFALTYGWEDFDEDDMHMLGSTLLIRGVSISTRDAAVPDAGATLLLLGCGLAGVRWMRKLCLQR